LKEESIELGTFKYELVKYFIGLKSVKKVVEVYELVKDT